MIKSKLKKDLEKAKKMIEELSDKLDNKSNEAR